MDNHLIDEVDIPEVLSLDDMLRERSGETGRAVLNNEMNIGIGTK